MFVHAAIVMFPPAAQGQFPYLSCLDEHLKIPINRPQADIGNLLANSAVHIVSCQMSPRCPHLFKNNSPLAGHSFDRTNLLHFRAFC